MIVYRAIHHICNVGITDTAISWFDLQMLLRYWASIRYANEPAWRTHTHTALCTQINHSNVFFCLSDINRAAKDNFCPYMTDLFCCNKVLSFWRWQLGVPMHTKFWQIYKYSVDNTVTKCYLNISLDLCWASQCIEREGSIAAAIRMSLWIL